MAEHTKIYRKVADGDTFFLRQRDDTLILSEALEGFFKDTDILAKALKGYKENHIPIINRLKKVNIR